MTRKHDETEMRELSEQELDAVNGGWVVPVVRLAIALIAIAAGVANDGK